MSHQIKKVLISSTARDLPEHRKEVMDACVRQGMFPVMMEYLPASDAEAISASLKLVDEADIYVGVFAHRYGYVPKENNPQQISITEMEYDHAVERDITRLIFLMDKTHPITIDGVEQGGGKVKLDDLKKRLVAERVVNYFNSPVDLRAHVINSLSQQRQPDLETFHYVSDIPAPPVVNEQHSDNLKLTQALIRLHSFSDPAPEEDVEEYKVNDYHALLDVIQSEINRDLMPFHISRDILVRHPSGISWRGAYHSHQISYGNKLFCPNAEFLSALRGAMKLIAVYLPASFLRQIGFTIP